MQHKYEWAADGEKSSEINKLKCSKSFEGGDISTLPSNMQIHFEDHNTGITMVMRGAKADYLWNLCVIQLRDDECRVHS